MAPATAIRVTTVGSANALLATRYKTEKEKASPCIRWRKADIRVTAANYRNNYLKKSIKYERPVRSTSSDRVTGSSVAAGVRVNAAFVTVWRGGKAVAVNVRPARNSASLLAANMYALVTDTATADNVGSYTCSVYRIYPLFQKRSLSSRGYDFIKKKENNNNETPSGVVFVDATRQPRTVCTIAAPTASRRRAQVAAVSVSCTILA